MSETARVKLREMQNRLVQDVAHVSNRNDYIRLQMYYNDIEEIIRLDNEANGE